MKRSYLSLCLLWVLITIPACKKITDTGCNGSYKKDIQPIINTKCAVPNCHNAGATLGDFTIYANLKQRADNGRIRTNVFELKIMPPASAVPLTDQEKERLKCWLDNGAPQD